jgi:hypothetical protein
MNEKSLDQDINYLHGQLDGLQALLLGMANLLLTKDQFRQQGLTRLAATRDAVMSQPVQETRLLGIDATEAWLLNVTA